MILLYENNLFKFYFDIISHAVGFYQKLDYYKNYALMQIDNIWAEFYSDFVKERGNKNVNFNGKNYFAEFLNKFEKDWINCMKEIYSSDEKKYKADITDFCIKKLKNKIDYDINEDDLNGDFNRFSLILKNIKLSDLFEKKQ